MQIRVSALIGLAALLAVIILSVVLYIVYTNDISVEDVTIQTYPHTDSKVLHGTVRNKGNREYRYVGVDFYIFDKTGKRIGNMIATVKDVGPKGKANFEEIFYEDVKTFKIRKIIKKPVYRSKTSYAIYRNNDEINIVKGETKITFTEKEEPLSLYYRVVGWDEDPRPPFDFVPISLVGIPWDKMPKDRPFVKEDFELSVSIFPIPYNQEVVEKMRAIINDKDAMRLYGFQKVQLIGNELSLKEFLFKGEKLKFSNEVLFIDLRDIEGIYGDY